MAWHLRAAPTVPTASVWQPGVRPWPAPHALNVCVLGLETDVRCVSCMRALCLTSYIMRASPALNYRRHPPPLPGRSPGGRPFAVAAKLPPRVVQDHLTGRFRMEPADESTTPRKKAYMHLSSPLSVCTQWLTLAAVSSLVALGEKGRLLASLVRLTLDLTQGMRFHPSSRTWSYEYVLGFMSRMISYASTKKTGTSFSLNCHFDSPNGLILQRDSNMETLSRTTPVRPCP
jgi:hypothetical protein